jgi:uncharacterized Zn finger protein
MCKHVAAVLYGVGARLDLAPHLLFVLRGVDESELLASAGQNLPLATAPPAASAVLADEDVAALFGIDMAEDVVPARPAPVSRPPRIAARDKAQKKSRRPDTKTAHPAATDKNRRRPKQIKTRPGRAARPR